jgi:hypothetical protein
MMNRIFGCSAAIKCPFAETVAAIATTTRKKKRLSTQRTLIMVLSNWSGCVLWPDSLTRSRVGAAWKLAVWYPGLIDFRLVFGLRYQAIGLFGPMCANSSVGKCH